MIELLMVMFAYLGGVDVRITDAPLTAYDQAHVTPTNPEGAYPAVARATACIDRRAHIEGSTEAMSDLTTLAHEMLHLVDCRDDGAYDGSLLPYEAETNDPAHEFVFWALRNPDTAAQRIRGRDN